MTLAKKQKQVERAACRRDALDQIPLHKMSNPGMTSSEFAGTVSHSTPPHSQLETRPGSSFPSAGNIGGTTTRQDIQPDDVSNAFGTYGVLVVGHGSRRDEANEDVMEVARRIAGRGCFPLVEAAFLEIARPTIDEAFTRCVESGASHIIVHPYFLSPGRHTRGDIPDAVRATAGRHPGVTYEITEPLAAHRLVIEASIDRIRATERFTGKTSSRDDRYLGKVYIVGAGPGDVGLLTIRALDLLHRADVVIYDYLVNPDLLIHVPLHAERIYAGKVGGGNQTPQDQINRLLIARAQRGDLVIRLKGGDPFLFGRGGEEGQALRAAGVPFEFVPGISSALAVPAYAGIPLTHRAFSSSVAVVSGARAGDGKFSEAVFSVRDADTIVILMGVSHLHSIAEDLILLGRSEDTPVAVIRWGSYESQLTVTGTLATIANAVDNARLRAPAVIVIGEVVRLRDELEWFESSCAGVTREEMGGLARATY